MLCMFRTSIRFRIVDVGDELRSQSRIVGSCLVDLHQVWRLVFSRKRAGGGWGERRTGAGNYALAGELLCLYGECFVGLGFS